MNDMVAQKPVVVGIDGSDTAIHAAQWAVEEALSRSVPLRLVAVTKPTHPSVDDYYADVHHAEAALRAAQDAIGATGRPVKIETEIVSGLPGVSLVEQSRNASMVCVGSVGIGRYLRALLGSTATELADEAHCPVAIIRPESELPPDVINWIAVAETDDERVPQAAFDEAQLRDAPILFLGNESGLEQWKRRYPGVHAYPVSDGAGVAHFMKKHDEWIRLAVIGGSESADIVAILGPHGHPRYHRTAASVLVVR